MSILFLSRARKLKGHGCVALELLAGSCTFAGGSTEFTTEHETVYIFLALLSLGYESNITIVAECLCVLVVLNSFLIWAVSQVLRCTSAFSWLLELMLKNRDSASGWNHVAALEACFSLEFTSVHHAHFDCFTLAVVMDYLGELLLVLVKNMVVHEVNLALRRILDAWGMIKVFIILNYALKLISWWLIIE